MNSLIGSSVYRRQLTCGTLSVTPNCSLEHLDELFDIAERRNPKRAFLFVSKVLGRHIPVSPKKMRETYQQMAKQFPQSLEGPILFIGMADQIFYSRKWIYRCVKRALKRGKTVP